MLEYLKNPNATQAAIKAGYSKKTAGQIGDRLLKNVQISEAIKQKLNREDAQATLTIDEIVKGLKSEATGSETGSARVAAWAHLAKYMGMFKDKGDSQTTIVLNAPDIARGNPHG